MKFWFIKYRLGLLIALVGITIGSLTLMPRLEIDPDLDNYVPAELDNRLNMSIMDSIFGGSEMILVMMQDEDVVKSSTLHRLEDLSEALVDLEGIERVVSPFDAQSIKTEAGFMVMEPFLETIPEDDEGCQELKSRIKENQMASRFFSTDDFELVSLILMKETNYSDDLLITAIDSVLLDHPGSEEVLLGGLPYVRYSITGNIRKDLKVLLPVALILMIFMLFFSFREWKGVFMPFMVVIMSMIFSFGVMALLGWRISLITVLMPIMLIAIANDYGIHMIARYQELAQRQKSPNMLQICIQIYTDLKRPIIIAGLTTIGGILGLLTHTMIPAAQIGVLTAIGIGFSLLLSIWFLPAMLSYMKPLEKKKVRSIKRLMSADKWLRKTGQLVTHHPRQVIIASAIVGVVGIAGIFFIKVDTNIEGYFLGKSKVSRSIELINEKLGGSQFISILFSGDVLSPEVLSRMEHYEAVLKADPAVGSVSSPVTLVKELSKGFYYEEEEGYNQIPSTLNEVYQLIEIFSMGGNEEAVEQFIDYNYENSRLIVSLKDGSNVEGKRLLKRMKELVKEDEAVQFIAGSSLTKIKLADMVVSGQIKSLLLAMVVVFILIAFIFRSGRAGFLSVLPLSVAILVLFGLMGFFGITLDIATALISSIMIGVGIDYTIHYLWRFKEELATGMGHKQATIKTLTTTGRGIVINAISVIIGFLVLTLSNFAPLRFFGALVVISISTCLVCALILIPSIVVLVKPRFLETK